MRTACILPAILMLSYCALTLDASGGEKAKVIRPFNGKSLDGWKVKKPAERSKWVVGKAGLSENNPRQLTIGDGGSDLVNAENKGVDIYTEDEWGDCTISLEVMVPKGSNSGIYVMGRYEVQVLDSYGKEKVGPGDMGGLYGAQPPRVNASKAPGQWQKFVIEFQAPRFEGDKKVANAMFKKVTLNGQVIHEDVEMQKATPGGVSGKEAASGPLMFQGNHGPVAYRNIEIQLP